MNWTTLFQGFLNGKPDAVQAIISCLTGLITAIGTGFVAASFRSQNRTNIEQRAFNQQITETHIRRIKPRFEATIVNFKADVNKMDIVISLDNASAFKIRIVSSSDQPQKIYGYNKWLANLETVTFKDFPVVTEFDGGSECIMIYFEDEDRQKYYQEFWIFRPSSLHPENEINVRSGLASPETVFPDPTAFLDKN